MTTIGLLHPGEMGAVVGALLSKAGRKVVWASTGRSDSSMQHAKEAGLVDVGGVENLVATSDVILSICPPHAAGVVAEEVMASGFSGLYVDANTIAPSSARAIAGVIEKGEARLVDAGIVGPPPSKQGTSRLFVSGAGADEVAYLFQGTFLEPIVVGPEVGRASAVKMAYAGWSKVSSALLLAVRSYARACNVESSLLAEWERSSPGLVARSTDQANRVHEKAWRFQGEMLEGSTAYAEAGLPSGFHEAAATLFGKLSHLRDAPDFQDPESVLDLLRAEVHTPLQ